MPLTAAEILREMRANPLTFFRHYWLTIAGGQVGVPSDVATFSFLDQAANTHGFTTGISGLLGRTKDRPAIRFTKQQGVALPNPDINNGFFNAYYVAMMQDENDLINAHYALPRNGPTSDANPDIMLTSQLSGCTFGIGTQAEGAQLVTHIQPNPGLGAVREHLGVTVRNQLADGIDSVFEREAQNEDTGYGNQGNRATIIGIRIDNRWNFYVQCYAGGGMGPLLEARKL